MPLGQPAGLLDARLAVAHPAQPVPRPAPAAAQQGRARPHPVQAGLGTVEQGVGAGGVDDAGLKPGGVDGLHRPGEVGQLAVQVPAVWLQGVQLGAQAGHRHIGQAAVDRQELFRLGDQKAPEAHARIHLDVGLGNGGAALRHGVEGQPRVHRAHSAHHVQIQQALQLLPVGGGAEHEQLLLHKTRLPQGGGLGHLADGEAADALGPEGAGQLHQAGPLAVPGEHAVDHRLAGPLFHHSDVVFQGVPLDDQRFHGPGPFPG